MAKVLVQGINRRLDKTTSLKRGDLLKCKECGCQFVPELRELVEPITHHSWSTRCPNSTCRNPIDVPLWQKKLIR